MHRQKGFAPMLAVVLIALALSGYVIYQKQTGTPLPQTTQVISSPTASSESSSFVASPAPTGAGETTNWKTYTNSTYKFNFKYPTDWEYQETQLGGTKYPSLIILLAQKGKLPPPGTLPYIRIQITDTTDRNYLSLYQWTDIVNKTKIGELDAEERMHKSVDMKEVIFVYSGSTYEIASENFKENQQQNVVYGQILSAFKFLDNNPEGLTCPVNGWQNCMPILSEEAKKGCSKEAVTWYKANCPNFQGIAQ